MIIPLDGLNILKISTFFETFPLLLSPIPLSLRLKYAPRKFMKCYQFFLFNQIWQINVQRKYKAEGIIKEDYDILTGVLQNMIMASHHFQWFWLMLKNTIHMYYL